MLAFFDDIYIITSPEKVEVVVACLQEQPFNHARIRLHGGKTEVWNGVGIRPPSCDVLDKSPACLEGFTLASRVSGIKVLGAPLGHPEFVTAHLERIAE